jgi:cell division protein ZapA (FtsZ GTPase activity inhibitor)
MNKSDEYLLLELKAISNRLSIAVGELKKKNGVIHSDLLSELDTINRLSVEV